MWQYQPIQQAYSRRVIFFKTIPFFSFKLNSIFMFFSTPLSLQLSPSIPGRLAENESFVCLCACGLTDVVRYSETCFQFNTAMVAIKANKNERIIY